MKKTLIIALCSLAVMFAACKKPVEPTPVDYTANYVGNYMGQFTLTITSMNNTPQSSLSFPIDSIRMNIAKVTEKADFEALHFVIDKPDQHYTFNLDLKLEGTKPTADSLNIIGSFSGNGSASIMGQDQVFDEVSGTISGRLLKQ